jgi:hypothetical protein
VFDSCLRDACSEIERQELYDVMSANGMFLCPASTANINLLGAFVLRNSRCAH